MLRRRNRAEEPAIKNSRIRSPREIAKASGPGDRYQLLIAGCLLPIPWGFVVVTIVLRAGLWVPATTLGSRSEAYAPVLVKVAFNKKLKHRILVTATGRTLYLWSDDTRGKPTCYDDDTYHCSKGWIPLR